MTKRTQHTVLARVTSHGSGGRGEIIVGHPALIRRFSDPYLTSKYFEAHEIGKCVVVKIMLSGKRRLTKNVRFDSEISNGYDFKRIYSGILEKENEDYERIVGLLVEDSKLYEESKSSPPTKEIEKLEIDNTWRDKIYITDNDRNVLNTIRKLSYKRHVAVMMIGPSGYGKSSVPMQMSKDWGMKYLRWDCATVRDPEEFFGFRGAQNGSTMNEDGKTIFSESLFTEVVTAGNCVIVLDELNRIDPYISNILFPLLDHAGKTNVAGHEIVVGPNVIFCATVNIGFQFTGTFTLDTALTNRFIAKIVVGPLPKSIEIQILAARGNILLSEAEQLVKIMQGLRKLNKEGLLSIDASTRVSIQIAELLGCGLSIKMALLYVVINGVSIEEAKLIADQLGYVIGDFT